MILRQASLLLAGLLMLCLSPALPPPPVFGAASPVSPVSNSPTHNFGRWMPVGDSITAGVEAPPGYRASLLDRLAADGRALTYVGGSPYFPDLPHEGWPGVATDWLYANQGPEGNIDSWIGQFHPDVISLMIGTNEAGPPSRSMQQMRSEYTILFDRIYADAPQVHVLWASIPPSDPALDRAPFEASLNALIQTMAGEQRAMGRNVTYVDVFDTLDPLTDLVSASQGDGVHPNGDGYSIIADDFRFAAEGP